MSDKYMNIELLVKEVQDLFKDSLSDYDYEHIFIDNNFTRSVNFKNKLLLNLDR